MRPLPSPLKHWSCSPLVGTQLTGSHVTQHSVPYLGIKIKKKDNLMARKNVSSAAL
jgi:hypothetical protein